MPVEFDVSQGVRSLRRADIPDGRLGKISAALAHAKWRGVDVEQHSRKDGRSAPGRHAAVLPICGTRLTPLRQDE